jgi:hypothetical protein
MQPSPIAPDLQPALPNSRIGIMFVLQLPLALG